MLADNSKGNKKIGSMTPEYLKELADTLADPNLTHVQKVAILQRLLLTDCFNRIPKPRKDYESHGGGMLAGPF